MGILGVSRRNLEDPQGVWGCQERIFGDFWCFRGSFVSQSLGIFGGCFGGDFGGEFWDLGEEFGGIFGVSGAFPNSNSQNNRINPEGIWEREIPAEKSKIPGRAEAAPVRLEKGLNCKRSLGKSGKKSQIPRELRRFQRVASIDPQGMNSN